MRSIWSGLLVILHSKSLVKRRDESNWLSFDIENLCMSSTCLAQKDFTALKFFTLKQIQSGQGPVMGSNERDSELLSGPKTESRESAE